MATTAKQTVKIVTDSTADMSPETLSRLDIEMVPLTVLFGNETFRDGVDITSSEFYKKLPTAQKLPTTSQPSPGFLWKLMTKLLPMALPLSPFTYRRS